MNSNYRPSCFDSSVLDNRYGIGKHWSAAVGSCRRPTGASFPATSAPKTCMPTTSISIAPIGYYPRPPFSMDLPVAVKSNDPLGRPFIGTETFEFRQFGNWTEQHCTITIGARPGNPNAEAESNPALQSLPACSRPTYTPLETIRLPMMFESSMATPLGNWAPGVSQYAGSCVNLVPQAPLYSRKVFVGGLPPDVTALSLMNSFCKFGALEVGWPRQTESLSLSPPKGFAFLQFQVEQSVHQLIRSCYRANSNNSVGYFTMLSSPFCEDKEVQVRPWKMSDSVVMLDADNLDERNAVFVGGVPRPLTACQLAKLFVRLFGPICSVAIETDDELEYPKGSARVTFRHLTSKIAAISARFVLVNFEDINKRVEIKPFVLRDQPCDRCVGTCRTNQMAQYFCPNIACLQYFCQTCWAYVHANPPSFGFHKPLVQKSSKTDWRFNKFEERNFA